MDGIIENLLEADKAIQTANHLIYITFPIVKHKKLLLKIILETRNCIMRTITAILQYEYVQKRIQLYQDPQINFQIFEEKCSQRYSISPKEVEQIKTIFEITKKHEDSAMEVMTKDKVVILSKDLDQEIVTPEEARSFVEMAKELFKKTKEHMINERKSRTPKKE